MRKYFTNRRCFLWSMAGLAVSIPNLPFETEQHSKIPTVDQDFVIVNGWVLTREDVAASKVTIDVV